MSKTEKSKGKFRGFREFYEEYEEDKPKKKKNASDIKGDRMKVKNKLRNFDPKNFSEEDFDDDLYNN
jgi:hypothetical protein